MKKWVLVVLLSLALGAGLSAQVHTVSAGVNAGFGVPVVVYMGLQAAYELQLRPELSLGANAFWEFYPAVLFAVAFTNEPAHLSGYGFEGQVHWYPFSRAFHLDAGLGWAHYMGMNTLLIAPGLGWRLDPGKPGGLIINPGIRLEIFSPLGDNIFEDSDKKTRLIPGNLGMHLNIGYSFDPGSRVLKE